MRIVVCEFRELKFVWVHSRVVRDRFPSDSAEVNCCKQLHLAESKTVTIVVDTGNYVSASLSFFSYGFGYLKSSSDRLSMLKL